VHERQVRSVHAAFLAEALVHELHDVVVLGVHDHDPAARRDLLHRVLQAAEVQPVRRPLRVWRQHVRREHLEGREALLDGLGIASKVLSGSGPASVMWKV